MVKVKIREMTIGKRLARDRWLYLLLAPGLLYFIIFKLIPMFGVMIVFQEYNPFTGFLDSPFVGLKHFQKFFGGKDFFKLFSNTICISLLNIVFYFPMPIVLSLLLNEIRHERYKRSVQTLVYVPHFLSWVIVASISYVLLTTDGGIVNGLIQNFGGSKIRFLEAKEWFRPLIVIQSVWKETGWGTIIFLAALAGVDMEQYEAAIVDGAGRFRQVWHITLPAIKGTIIILLILRMGSVLNTGFDQIFLMSNSVNRSVSDVFDVYTYRKGLIDGSYSFSAAVGLFKAVIGMVLVYTTNWIAKRAGESGIF
ncbi:MAG: ABC transporter permease subunit [Clostridium sp.]|jgi:putative aldouronate transport system permease protein|nr:ABC transporter permease subunit [Clostridium sp.]